MMSRYLSAILVSLSLANAFLSQTCSKNGVVHAYNHASPSMLSSSTSDSENTLQRLMKATTSAQKNLCVFLIGSLFFVGNGPLSATAIDAASLKQYTITPGAGIDPSQLKKYTAVQEALDAADIEYTMLKSGTSYREFREGV